MKIGYARVSTDKQDYASQVKLLQEYGCAKVFAEKESGAKSDREQIAAALAEIGSGDVLVVPTVDRLARDLRVCMDIADELHSRSAGLVVLNMGGSTIDTHGSMGRFVLQIFAGIAEFFRAVNKEHQRRGIDYTKASTSRHMGRPQLELDSIIAIKALAKAGMKDGEIARRTGTSKFAVRTWRDRVPAYKTAKVGDKLERIPLDDADRAELAKYS